MANEAHKIKLLVLWDILCKNTDENHALNTDELSELLALRGLNVSRKILVQDIATLCDNGYEVLSYKKKYHYYYVVNRSLETAEVVMLADVINASKLPVAQKKALVGRLAETLCTHQAESISKHIISLDKGRKGSSSFIYNVDAIEHAINENKQISFLYFNYDEKHKKVYRKNGNRYTVSPAFSVIYTAVEKAGEKISCDPTVLTADETCTYKRTQEIMRYSNEIARLTASPSPSFKAGKKLILECASLKFQACRENKGASYTNRILQLTKNKKYDIDYISDVVSKIIVEKDGTVTVAMINGAKISNREVNDAGTSEKSCNEDRCQSDSCQAE